MTDKRTATKAILEIEETLSKMSKFVQNTDNNVKLILDRLNKVTKQLEENKSKELPKEKTKSKKIIEQPMVAEPFVQQAKSINELEEDPLPRHTKRRDSRVPVKKTLSVAVSQIIETPNSKPAVLAQVEILNSDGKIIKQTRTNTNGRWVAPLEPGFYTVNVLKRGDQSKKPMNTSFTIEIPEGDGPLELPSTKVT